MRKILKVVLIIFGISITLFFCYFFVGNAPEAKNIIWGVTFSQKQAQLLGLDWKRTYLAVLDNLKVRDLRVVAYWDLVEKEKGKYDFSDLDFQIEEAQKRKAKVILVIGRKVPRWPECHEPKWIQGQNLETKNQELLRYIEETINRYKGSSAIWAWQVENEPFFPFGECPPLDKKFLKEEIKLAKSLDKRPVIVSASGTRFWIEPAIYGDAVSFSLYRMAYFHEFKRFINYPFPPVFYYRKARLIEKVFHKSVFCSELQAEPWEPVFLSKVPVNKQLRDMDLGRFEKNIGYAKKTGIDRFYFWGVEWWYWMKEKQEHPEFWQEAKKFWH